jgi:AraC-like DNA-binding protein
MLALLAHHERQQERATGINGDLERSVAGGLAFSLLMLLVAVIYRSKADTPRMTTRKDILTHDFFELLSVHFETERKVAFYASRLCVTPKHLSAMVKQVTLLPIQEWINNVTVLNIKRRLLTTTDTVQQISEDLNICPLFPSAHRRHSFEIPRQPPRSVGAEQLGLYHDTHPDH